MIPITDTPKRIPITLSDTLTLRDTLKPITLSDTHYGHTIWLGKDCCLAGKGSPDGRTDTILFTCMSGRRPPVPSSSSSRDEELG